jgi:hypothetical protein
MMRTASQASVLAMKKRSDDGSSSHPELSTEEALRASKYCLSVKPTQGSQVWLVRSAKELAALKRSVRL